MEKTSKPPQKYDASNKKWLLNFLRERCEKLKEMGYSPEKDECIHCYWLTKELEADAEYIDTVKRVSKCQFEEN